MNEKILTKFILAFLIDKPDYLKLSSVQQQLVFETSKTIMVAIYNAIKHDNVYPVIMCGFSSCIIFVNSNNTPFSFCFSIIFTLFS